MRCLLIPILVLANSDEVDRLGVATHRSFSLRTRSNRCHHLIHDRDPLFTHEFLSRLKDAGVESVKLPPRSPNLNAHAERFVLSVEESCLERLILFGETS
jgi:hypothetical protein